MKGLCLSGGGIKAAAHIGALKAFEEEKIKFDCVSGASSGSIIATMYALGYNSDEMWKLFQKYYKKIKYAEWKQIIKLILGLIIKQEILIDGLNSGKIIEKIIEEICEKNNVTNINQIKMPLQISMVDLQKGTVYLATSHKKPTKAEKILTNISIGKRETLLDETNLQSDARKLNEKNIMKGKRGILLDDTQYITDIPIGTAVRASCSFPIVFSPCKFGNLELIDGGTRENLPWKGLKDIGADKVYGVSFDTIYKEKQCCQNLIDVATRAMALQERELSTYEKEGIDHLITIKMKKISLLDNTKSEELYEMGYMQTKRQIEKITKFI